MARISVRRLDQASPAPLPPGLSGQGSARAYFAGPRDPLWLHLIELGSDQILCFDDGPGPRTVYVQDGAIACSGHDLATGSSMIVEAGASTRLLGRAERSGLLVFMNASAPADRRTARQVHLLPREQVPSAEVLAGSGSVGGAIHADSQCPGCAVWLHENWFAAGAERHDAEAGIHSHTEDEIIVAIDGDIRLGAHLFPRGTAVAIGADTLYSFTPGPAGLRFVNFRADRPGDIRFRSGVTMSETEYWSARLPRPPYLSPRDE